LATESRAAQARTTSAMTHFLDDILRQPEELQRAFDYLCGTGERALQTATEAVRKARHVYLTGIGSSWHAALSVAPIFYRAANPVYTLDASELLQFATLPQAAVVIVISRSGRSIEVVNLLAKARESGAVVIGISNSPSGALAQEAQIAIVVQAKLDHAISVNTYTTLAAVAGALATASASSFDGKLAASLVASVAATESRIPDWRAQIAESDWFARGKVTYFLGRGGALGSCHEARLLWEEGAKSPATALGTGGFRHGPQEMVAPDVRFGLWIDAHQMREQDLSVARDLRRLGASVLIIGQNVPDRAGDLVFQIPSIALDWQFLIDIIPAQLAAEHLARLQGVDCDSFRICSYIVDSEFGLMNEEVADRTEKH
jgi:glucosamine--fructose-6-phosphate aminotransferase (isomerizing)